MVNNYKVHQILPHLWHIQECLDNPGFMTLVVGKEKALLFDTGYGSGDLETAVRELTELPVEVVLSHGHFDHVCGAWQFDSAWIHEADTELCLEDTSYENRALRWGMNTRHKEKAADIAKVIDFDFYVKEGCTKLKPLRDRRIFDLGGITAEVVPMPGHTIGSIGMLLHEDRIFLAGDSANPTFFLFTEHSGTWENHKENLRKLLDMPFDHFLIGHRPTLFEKKKILDFLAAAEKANPAMDRIRVMADGGRIVYRSQYGFDEEPESCYMLYREDQVPGSGNQEWEGENVIVTDSSSEEGLRRVRVCLKEGARVFAWVKRNVPKELEEMHRDYGARLRILEEVFLDDPYLYGAAMTATNSLCRGKFTRIY